MYFQNNKYRQFHFYFMILFGFSLNKDFELISHFYFEAWNNLFFLISK